MYYAESDDVNVYVCMYHGDADAVRLRSVLIRTSVSRDQYELMMCKLMMHKMQTCQHRVAIALSRLCHIAGNTLDRSGIMMILHRIQSATTTGTDVVMADAIPGVVAEAQKRNQYPEQIDGLLVQRGGGVWRRRWDDSGWWR